MKKIFLICMLSISISAFSQEESEIMDVINNVFIAMRSNDSTLLKSCFTSKPNTFTAYVTNEGDSKLVKGDFQKFVNAIGQPKDQTWNEPIWNEKVEIDGNLASVWVDYAFYVDNKFSHCGVDAFHLIKEKEAWKIFHLVDTRRKENCIIPDDKKP